MPAIREMRADFYDAYLRHEIKLCTSHLQLTGEQRGFYYE